MRDAGAILRRLKTARLPQPCHGEGGTGIVFSGGGDVVVPDDVVEVVAGGEDFGDLLAGGELGERVGFPALHRAAAFVFGADKGETRPAAGQGGVIACVGEFEAD